MNINRNVLKIVAGALLAASLPAGAQLLGGNVGGAMHGALGGGIGQGMHGAGGVMGGGSITGPDVAGAAGKVRDSAKQAGERTKQAGEHTKDAAVNTKDAVGSRVQETRGAATGAVNGAATSTTAGQGGVLFDGSTSADVEKQALGRDVSATGAAAATGRADRSGLGGNGSAQADVAAKKTGAAPAPAATAQ